MVKGHLGLTKVSLSSLEYATQGIMLAHLTWLRLILSLLPISLAHTTFSIVYNYGYLLLGM